MMKKLIFGIICVLILILPAYAGDGKQSCEGKCSNKAACDKQSDHKCVCSEKEDECNCPCCQGKCDGECKDCTCCCKEEGDDEDIDEEESDEEESGEEESGEEESDEEESDEEEAYGEMPCGEMPSGEMPCKMTIMMDMEQGMMMPEMHQKMMMQMQMQKENPLERKARAFIKGKVQKIAIMPFSDYTATSPMDSRSASNWAGRRIHDYMSAEFFDMGKLVIPYDAMAQAIADMKNVGKKKSETEGLSGSGLLSEQMTRFRISSESQQEVFKELAKSGLAGGGGGMMQISSISFTPEEIKAIGKNLGVQAVFAGAISDYGSRKYVKMDARTFIPPFLGLWNPSVQSMCRMMVYLYDTETGELIWSSLEEVKREPTFPLFSNEGMNYDWINQKLAKQIVEHFREQMMVMIMEPKKPSTGGPGTTRREKDVRVIIRQEK